MKAGTIIICPECERPQLKTTKDLPPGGQMKDAAFESLGYDMEHAIRMGCYECGALWYRDAKIKGCPQLHTQEGWIDLMREKPQRLIK